MSERRRVVWAMCGSFCTFEKTAEQMERMAQSGVQVLPLMSFNAAGLDTRFGTAESWKKRVEAITGSRPIETLQGAEPLGPQDLADAMIVAPCTGATLAKLAAGISDTPVTLGAKSMLRGAKLQVVVIPAKTLCENCGCVYPTVAHGRTCPACGSGKTHLIQGNETMIRDITVPEEEEPEPPEPPAGTAL